MEPKDIDFAAMPQTAVNVVTKPAEFFQGMPKTGGFLEPLVFAVIMGLIAGIIQAILGFVGLGPAGGYGGWYDVRFWHDHLHADCRRYRQLHRSGHTLRYLETDGVAGKL
ncbi:MAG: hypothetical protein MZV70_25240 [Desulfobacterales bacterium]|nr:hypothetical protein [Desulfobacterales bacterium]